MFYVYTHSLSGIILYIGVGTGNRAFDIGNRSKVWLRAFKDAKMEVNFIKRDLTRDEALHLKTELLLTHKSTAVNNRNTQTFADMDYEYFNHRFEINTSSPSGLCYKVSNAAYGKRHREAGCPAGFVITSRGKSYWRIKVSNRSYMVHRIIYLLKNKQVHKNLTINHINGDGLDNHHINLEEVSQAINSRKKVVKNKSGYVNIQANIRGGIVKGYTFYGRSYGLSNTYFSAKREGSADLALCAAVAYKNSRAIEEDLMKEQNK